MSTDFLKRKLTAILSGCKRVSSPQGQVIDSPGDNTLAEYGSVVDAAQCSEAARNQFKARNADLPENRRMEFRIGANLGDMIEEESRIYWDGLNIAPRA